MPPSGPIDHVTTSGTFNLDGGSFEVDNNVWIVGNSDEVLVIDAAHDENVIADAVGLGPGGMGGEHPAGQLQIRRIGE